MENGSAKEESVDKQEGDYMVPDFHSDEADKNRVKVAVVSILISVLVCAGLFLFYFPHFQENGKPVTAHNKEDTDKRSSDTSTDEGNISFNAESMKLLDLNGYKQQWSENFLPVFSPHGNWIMAPMIKDDKDVMVLGLRNGQTREIGLNAAVSPNFKELAYAVTEGNGLKITTELFEHGQTKQNNLMFEKILQLYYGADTNLLNILGMQDGRTVWYVDGQKKAEFDPMRYLTSDNAKMSDDKTKLAVVGLKNNKPILVVNGEEKVFEAASAIDLIGFSRIGNHIVYTLSYAQGTKVFYSDDKEVARNVLCDNHWAVISPTGDKIACPSTGTGASGNQYVSVFGENPKVFRKAYYETSFPSFSPDGKELAYIVNTGETQDVGVTKWMAVINEKEEKQYDEVRPVFWGGNNAYAYIAQELTGDKGDTIETNFVVVNGVEQHKFSGKFGDAPRIEAYQLAVNPVNGKVGYVVCASDVTTDEKWADKNALTINLTNITHRCFVMYDGQSQPEFGLISDKPQFTPDGKHIVYRALSKDEKTSFLVIDGKAVQLDGIIWSGANFSPDGKKVGVYIVKNNEYWWRVYDIADALDTAEVLPSKDIESVQAGTWNDVSSAKKVNSTPDGWKKYTDKNFEIYYPAEYREQFENHSFKIVSKSSVYKKISGVDMLQTGIEISNSETNSYASMIGGATFEQWKSQKDASLQSALSKWPSDDFKTELSSGSYDGHNVPVTTMRWTSGGGECFSKDVYLYSQKKRIDVGFHMKTCGESEKETKTFEDMLATFAFIE